MVPPGESGRGEWGSTWDRTYIGKTWEGRGLNKLGLLLQSLGNFALPKYPVILEAFPNQPLYTLSVSIPSSSEQTELPDMVCVCLLVGFMVWLSAQENICSTGHRLCFLLLRIPVAKAVPETQ